MKIADIYKNNRVNVSIEVFPPKTPKGISKLKETLSNYKEFNPDFISVTYGAGGSTRDTTFDVANFIKNELDTEVMPHFTCVNHTKNEILDILKKYNEMGIDNILALRGDPPGGEGEFKQIKDGFLYASELVEFIKENSDFSVGCAGFPEKHIESENEEKDCYYLAQKIKKGVDFAITQFFFDNNAFFKWRDRLSSEGVSIPLIAGIWLPSNQETTIKFSGFNNVMIPQEIHDIYAKYSDFEDRQKASIEFTRKQVMELIENQVSGLHIYSFNKIEPVEVVMDLIK